MCVNSIAITDEQLIVIEESPCGLKENLYIARDEELEFVILEQLTI